jgi:hypothetical protein
MRMIPYHLQLNLGVVFSSKGKRPSMNDAVPTTATQDDDDDDDDFGEGDPTNEDDRMTGNFRAQDCWHGHQRKE